MMMMLMEREREPVSSLSPRILTARPLVVGRLRLRSKHPSLSLRVGTRPRAIGCSQGAAGRAGSILRTSGFRQETGGWGRCSPSKCLALSHTHDSTHTPLSLSVCIKRSDIDKTGSLSLSLSLSLKHTHTHTELRGREAGKIETGPSDPSLTDSDAGPRPDPGSRVWAKR
jgi:hypothetical protein